MRHSRTQCLPPPRLCKQGQRHGRENTSARTKTGSHASPSPSLHCVSLPLLPPLVVVARPVIVFATRRGCEKLRLAFRACFSFGADIYFAVVNFKLPSMLSTCHMPLACHADIGRAAQREPINCRKLLAKYALRIYCALWLGYCGGFKYAQDMQDICVRTKQIVSI